MNRLTQVLSLAVMLTACSAPPALMTSQPTALNAFSGPKPLQIRIFRSYGNEQVLHVQARVMKPENLSPESPSDSSLVNFWRNLKSLTVHEVPNVAVDLQIQDKHLRLISDSEGMLKADTDAFGPLAPGVYTLAATVVPGQGYTAPAIAEKMVIQPAAAPSMGLVSDIDDTIKISNVTHRLQSLRRLLFTNSYTVEPVPGTAVLYQRLDQRLDQVNAQLLAQNRLPRPQDPPPVVSSDEDIHYLSGSPLNLSEQIYHFMDNRGFPQGSVDLKKWGFGPKDDNPFTQQDYKQGKLRTLFQTYPDRRFLLFGDSGEKDPEVYKQIAAEFPGRVQDIFIRNVNHSDPQDPRFQGVHLTQDAVAQAQILQQAGLLQPEDVAAVEQAESVHQAYLATVQ